MLGDNNGLNSMQLGFYGKQVLTLQNSGNVGLNTSVPAFPLDVSGSTRVTANMGIGTVPSTAGGSPAQGICTLGNGTCTLNLAAAYSNAYGTVSHIEAFNVGNTAKNQLCLNGFGGNVGIGNISPSYTLDVSGNIRTSSFMSNGANTNFIQYMTGTGTSSEIKLLGSGYAHYSIFNSAGTFSINNTSISNSLGVFGTPLITIAGNNTTVGNVGINTSTPAYQLDVSGSARVTGSSTFAPMQTGNAVSVYSAQGLAVGGSLSSSALLMLNTSASGTPFIGFDLFTVNGASLGLDPSDSGKFKIITGGGTAGFSGPSRLTITSSGLVGINNSSPAYSLDVSGPARVTGTLTVPSCIQTTPVYGLYNMAQITVNTSYSNWPILTCSREHGPQRIRSDCGAIYGMLYFPLQSLGIQS